MSEKSINERSGNVFSADPAVAVLYTLLRDGDLAPGRLEQVISEVLKDDFIIHEFSNGWLATYADDVIKRLSTS